MFSFLSFKVRFIVYGIIAALIVSLFGYYKVRLSNLFSEKEAMKVGLDDKNVEMENINWKLEQKNKQEKVSYRLTII